MKNSPVNSNSGKPPTMIFGKPVRVKFRVSAAFSGGKKSVRIFTDQTQLDQHLNELHKDSTCYDVSVRTCRSTVFRMHGLDWAEFQRWQRS